MVEEVGTRASTDRVRVRGGVRLSGRLRVSGAKNAAVALLPACLLADGRCELWQLPDITDADVMIRILESLGARVDRREGVVRVTPVPGTLKHEVPYDEAKKVRASSLLLGALLARLGKAVVPLPGGCDIGPRPVDLHLKGLAELGARVRVERGYVVAEADQLVGSEIYLDFPSVGATENLMMAAVLARGTTVIRGAAREPEITDLQNLLNAMGARIRGAGLDVIRIEGVGRLHGCEHTVIPDRIEVGSLMAAAAVTGGDVRLEGVIAEHVEAVAAKLREMGAEVVEDGDGALRVRGPERLRAVDLKTMPYPGIPTDMQPQFTALAAVADGTSVITETIFENRFKQAEELRRMGAQIKVVGHTAVVQGVDRLFGATVSAPALREGMALVLAGLVAEGETRVYGTEHIDRGYERLEDKLRTLGADVERVTE